MDFDPFVCFCVSRFVGCRHDFDCMCKLFLGFGAADVLAPIVDNNDINRVQHPLVPLCVAKTFGDKKGLRRK